MFKPTEVKEITRKEKQFVTNYFPCVYEGKTTAVTSPHNDWTSIEWQYLHDTYQGDVFMMAVIYIGTEKHARVSFGYEKETGKIFTFNYERKNTFNDDNAFNFRSMQECYNERKMARIYISNLLYYFRRINNLEYEKALTERKTKDMSGSVVSNDFVTPSIVSKKKKPVYDPNIPKTFNYINSQKQSKPRVYNITEWNRAGHYRHYKNGKMVYIKPTKVHKH